MLFIAKTHPKLWGCVALCVQVVYLKGDITMKEKNLGLKEINAPSALVLVAGPSASKKSAPFSRVPSTSVTFLQDSVAPNA